MEYDHRFSGSPPTTPPLKTKHHHHCLISCFRPCPSHAASDDKTSPRPLLRSPTSWIRSKVHDFPDNCSRCPILPSHYNWGKHHHQRRHSAEFRYDPLSYALNFDEGVAEDESAASADELRHRRFSSRLPLSPPRGGSNRGGGFDDLKAVRGSELPPLRF
ncbi:hypothetical protein Cni_G25755 [Canna indica]|uniref:Uncharacterized protein n=1 Tax=Canna indica TaxID=4628 RepID=A0AAQ3L4Y1_9LILI|nr:hypothetical protein Cni_G25755 [Canna indica]